MPEVVEASAEAEPLPPIEAAPIVHETASVPEPPKEKVPEVHIDKPDIFSEKPKKPNESINLEVGISRLYIALSKFYFAWF